MDRALLKRYKLLSLLNDNSFMTYIRRLIQAFQDKSEASVPLSVIVDLVSNAAKYEPQIVDLRFEDMDMETRERVMYLLGLATIERLTEMGYLGTSPKEPKKPQEELAGRPSKSVFIIHGRNLEPAREIRSILTQIGLNPIILHEQPIISRTVVEKLEKYSDVGYAVVILSRDEAMPPRKLFRTQQNVLVELGYFMGLLGRDRVLVLLQKGVEVPSDIEGILYISFNDSLDEVRAEILSELKVAGYEVKV